MNSPEEDTVEWVAPKVFSEYFFAPDAPRFEVKLAAASHPGKVRSRNEDHYIVFRRTRSCEVLSTNLPPENLSHPVDAAYCFVVADGIGGSDFGDFASQLALSTLMEMAGRATSWVMKFTDIDAQEVRQRVGAYVEQIQQRFHECIRGNPDRQRMGTTLTAACLLPPHAVIVHIGDSRAYLYRDGELKQITRDQTLAQDMIDAGAAPEDVRRFSHLLTNSLGGAKEHVDADVIHVELEPRDRLFLCTDGLSDMVDDSAITKSLAANDVNTACDRLIQAALDGGGEDNITVIIGELLANA